MARTIVPRYKLLICYDINEGTHDAYYQFVLNELGPTLQGLGLYMLHVYHTAYGNYPQRQLEFAAEDLDTVLKALKSDTWRDVQNKFQEFTCNYSQKLVHFQNKFQF